MDLITCIQRVETLLSDNTNLIWTDADLTEAVRLALDEVSLSMGQKLTLSGLDGAVAASLPDLLEGMLVVGAAGYAAVARAVERAEQFELANEGGLLHTWAEERLRDFRALLSRWEAVHRTSSLFTQAVANPWGVWTEEEGG